MESALWFIAGMLLLPLIRFGWNCYQNSDPERREYQRLGRLYAMALQLERENVPRAATDIWLALLKTRHQFAFAFLVEGCLWRHRQDYPDTSALISAYHTLLEHRPENGELHFKLGVLLHQDGRLSEAREHWHKTLHLSDDGWADQARERLAAEG